MLYGFGAMPSSFSGDPAAPAPKACPPGQVGYPPFCVPNWFAPKPAAAPPGCQPGFTNQGGVCLPEWVGKPAAPAAPASPAYATPAAPAYATPASPAYVAPTPDLVAGQGGSASSGEKKFLGLPAKLLGLPTPVVLLGVGSVLLLGFAMMGQQRAAKQKAA